MQEWGAELALLSAIVASKTLPSSYAVSERNFSVEALQLCMLLRLLLDDTDGEGPAQLFVLNSSVSVIFSTIFARSWLLMDCWLLKLILFSVLLIIFN